MNDTRQDQSLFVLDDFHPFPDMVRDDALRLVKEGAFTDFHGPDGQIYKRVCVKEIPGIRQMLYGLLGPMEVHGMAYRLNFNNEAPNAAIHSDLGWGTHALVFYLSDGPSGTAFWKHNRTGTNRIENGDVWLFEQVCNDWNDETKWKIERFVGMKYNRALIYESALFHSRYPFEAFGDCPENGRLIVVAFFTPGKKK